MAGKKKLYRTIEGTDTKIEVDYLDLDTMIEHLKGLREKHGGSLPVYYQSDYDWALQLHYATMEEELSLGVEGSSSGSDDETVTAIALN